jgi:hypothetical protein
MRKIIVVLAFAAAAFAAVAVAIAAAGGPSGLGVQPQQVGMTDANACVGGQKIEDPTSNTYSVKYDGFTGSLTITVHDTSSGPTFDFDTGSSGDVLTSIYVKGGPTANFYDYLGAPTFGGVSSDTGLHSPINPNNGKFYGLSHICIFTDKL